MPRLYVISGEVSGDIHGAKVIKRLRELSTAFSFRGVGGSKMKQEGVSLISDISGSSTMGFLDVLRKLGSFRKLLKKVKADILEFRPEAVLLIDYGGFNMRMASFCRQHGIPVHYFILPKVWAWNEGRIKKLKNAVDFAYVIFPFEELYFSKHGMKAVYVGNPVEEHITTYRVKHNKPRTTENSVALLPGSRPQEIKRILPTMLELAGKTMNIQFTVAVPSSLKEKMDAYSLPPNVKIRYNQMYEVADKCAAAIVTSGTANLEVALLGTPLIVVYKADPISYLLAKQFVKIDYISPVNLIANRSMVPELLQGDFRLDHLNKELNKAMKPNARNQAKENRDELMQILGEHTYSKTVANRIWSEIKTS
jgi:lipid-A-disaccharide synthase